VVTGDQRGVQAELLTPKLMLSSLDSDQEPQCSSPQLAHPLLKFGLCCAILA